MPMDAQRWALFDAALRRAVPLRLEWLVHTRPRADMWAEENCVAFASIAETLRAARPITGPGRSRQLRAEVLRAIDLVEALPYPWHKGGAAAPLHTGETVLAGIARTMTMRGDGHGAAHDAASLCRSIFVVAAVDTYSLLKTDAPLSGVDKYF